MFGMSPPQDQPIHWDRHKANLNITLMLALIIAIFGVVTGFQPVPIIAGMGIAAYSWLTTARQYYIYRDALVIVYGRPRVKVISFSQVSHIELLALPMGDRLRVQVVGGRPILLAAQDSETFRQRLDTALEDYRSAHPEQERGEGPDATDPTRPPY